MKTSFELTILQPQISACSESWHLMKPHEKGAFCLSCKKVVHDLENLNGDQLAKFLIKHENKAVCGRINAEFINKPVSLIKKQPERYSFNFLFAIALIFVFGTTLFSCDEKEHTIIKSTIENTFLDNIEINKETIKSPKENYIDFIETHTLYNYPFETTIQADSSVSYLNEIVVSVQQPEFERVGLAGNFYTLKRIEYVEIDTLIPEPIIAEINKELPLKVYPNPASENITIDYEIIKEGFVMLSIFSIKGEKLGDIFTSSSGYTGKYSETFNVSEVPPGMYLVILINEDDKKVYKLNVVH